MMLHAAVELSQLVQQQNEITWDDHDNVEKYINKLRKAVDKLARDNNKLAHYHYKLKDKVSSRSKTY